MKLVKYLLIALLATWSLGFSYAQQTKIESFPQESSVKELIRYLEFTLNTVGDAKTEVREKERIINESYTKLFESKFVFIEDDLDPAREVITNKYVQGYLKDIDFFFKSVSFSFQVLNISAQTKPDGSQYFLVEMNREINGIDSQNQRIQNKKQRFVEINFNEESGDLKIASIYTLGINEKEMLNEWWQGLSYGWLEVFRNYLTREGEPDYKQLKKITEIQTLDISGNKILTDLNALKIIKNLLELNISNSSINDISSIRYLSGLQNLHMSGLKVSNLSELTYSNSLKILDASNSPVTETRFLSNLKGLEDLNLSGTFVSEIGEVKYLTRLKILDLSNTTISSIKSLANLPDLIEVSLEGTNVSDPKPLANHKKIKYLNFSYSQISDLTVLTGMESLEEIDLVGTAVSDLSPLANLPNLKKINCNQSLVKETQVGEFMKENPNVLIIHDTEKLLSWWNSLSLTWQNSIKSHLEIVSNPTETDLAKLARLDSLSISKSDSMKSSPLTMLPSLKFLNASNLAFDNYSVIKNLIKLEILNLGGTNIKDLSPLSDLKNLETLNIENTGVSSLAPLSSLSRLKIVYADGSKITTKEVLSFKNDNPAVRIIYRTKQLQNWWETLPYEWSNYFIRAFNLAQDPDTKSLHELTSARELIIDNNSGIHSLNVLHIYPGLKKLVLDGVDPDDLSYLGNLNTLEDLTITRMNLQDLSFLKSLTNLRRLDISETPVSTLSPLSENSNLEFLDCSGTLIRNIRPLMKLTNLKSLDFSNTKVGSLRSVMGMNLDYLACFNTRIAYYQVEKYKEEHASTEVVYY